MHLPFFEGLCSFYFVEHLCFLVVGRVELCYLVCETMDFGILYG